MFKKKFLHEGNVKTWVCQQSTYHWTICWAPGQLCSRRIRTFSSM